MARKRVQCTPPPTADHAATRDRIVAMLAARFACYGVGTASSSHNPLALTLRDQPVQFGFGVPVADVVDAVLAMLPHGPDASTTSAQEER